MYIKSLRKSILREQTLFNSKRGIMTLNVEAVEYSEVKDNLCLSQDSIVPTEDIFNEDLCKFRRYCYDQFLMKEVFGVLSCEG